MSSFVRFPTFPDHTGMKERQYIQELIDDFLKGRLDNWETVALMQFLATDPEWFDYFFIELVLYSHFADQDRKL